MVAELDLLDVAGTDCERGKRCAPSMGGLACSVAE